ncbi:MAG: acetylornithine/succinylornithine family transaminase [Acidimicrobiia bacterium]|nr:acetylornithine/succinylornithine family transaminase [Acidimicrobiia bacterium]
MGNFAPPPVQFLRGSGTELWDSDDKRYLDFLGGLAVVSLGHSHPEVSEAIARQARTLLHVSSLYATEHAWHVAVGIDRHVGATRGPGGNPAGQVFFCNSGAEAVEAAMKLARKWAGYGRYGVVTTYGSFHGRTLATLAATGQPTKHEPFAPMPEGFRHVALDDVDALHNAVDETTAAIMLESIQGEGGVNPASGEFLAAARQLADERGLLLILDEVQTGLCRTGRWFGYQHYGVEPDVVCLAKALGNGVPIGALWARADVAGSFVPGDHGSTYSGQPLATAAARAVLQVMERDRLDERAERVGAVLRDRLCGLDEVSSVRGAGLLLAAELVDHNGPAVAAACLEAGLVVNGVTPTSLRLAPPLTVAEGEIDEAMDILVSVLAQVPVASSTGT